MTEYYVYTLIDPNDHLPFYVGKGSGSRAEDHYDQVGHKWSRSNRNKRNKIISLKEQGIRPIVDYLPCDSEEHAYEQEKILIGKIKRKTNGGPLLNLTDGGEGGATRNKRVDQYNVFREFIRTHESITAATVSVGLKCSNGIGLVCKRDEDATCRRVAGFVWCYHGDVPDWNWVFQKIKPVYQWSLVGESVARYENLSCAASSLKISPTNLSRIISNPAPRKFFLGCQFSYEPFFPNKTLYNPKTRKVECITTGRIYGSAGEAERSISGKTTRAVTNACNGRSLTAYGYRWRYVDGLV